MKIIIETIKHNQQRYCTCGDWYFKKGDLYIFVSDTKNVNYEFLVGIHEMIEAQLCACRGIDEKKITAFDKRFEKKRKKDNMDEPGDDDKAPYKREHRFAENIERQIAHELGVDWKKYERKIESL